jgi:putative phage-type endonuclease
MDTSVNTTHIVHELVQGEANWHAHRRTHFNASDASAVLGISPYKTRAQLLREMSSGLTVEPDEATQRRFDAGHRFEAIARPWAEEIIGEDLYPITASRAVEGLPLSASYDGVNMDESIVFEHKSLNAELRASLEKGEIPRAYWPQMEQQLLIIGAEKCLFMASSGDKESMLHAWYESDDDTRIELLSGWAQFQKDLAEYKPEPTAPATPVGRAPETLPALRIEVTGMVTHSNLDAFKANALAVIGAINRTLETDEDFANAEATVKWCGDVESRLKAAKEHAQSQAESIDALFKTIDDIAAEARKTRLELDKLVKDRKVNIRIEIAEKVADEFKAHIASLNATLGKPYMPQIETAFNEVMRSKRTVQSLRDAVHHELTRVKINAGEKFQLIQQNLGTLRELAADYKSLFPDTAVLVLKANDDLRATITARISEHKEEAERERERIRKEEAEKLERQQAEADALRAKEAQAAAVQQPAVVAQQAAAPVVVNPAPSTQLVDQGQAPVSGNVVQMRQPDSGALMNITTINAKLYPVGIDSTGLKALGFETVEPTVGMSKTSKLYRAADFDRICEAIVNHVNKARQPLAA